MVFFMFSYVSSLAGGPSWADRGEMENNIRADMSMSEMDIESASTKLPTLRMTALSKKATQPKPKAKAKSPVRFDSTFGLVSWRQAAKWYPKSEAHCRRAQALT
jgi:hypothetical protein